jgi:hypothetical protein
MSVTAGIARTTTSSDASAPRSAVNVSHATLVAALVGFAGIAVAAGEPQSRPVEIVGRVIDSDGAPLPGAEVRLTRSMSPEALTVIATDSTFRLAVQPGPRVMLTAKLAGYGGGAYGQLVPGDSGQVFDLRADSGALSVTLRMWKLGLIVGRVMDEYGDPVIGARVVALRQQISGGRSRLSQRQFARTNDRGEYRLIALEPGEYAIALTGTRNAEGRTDYPTTYAPGTRFVGRASLQTLRPGDERSGVDITIDASRAFAIDGQVDGLDRKRPPPVVELLDASDGPGSMTPLPIASATVDDRARFHFSSVAPGAYRLRILDFPPKKQGQAFQGALRFTIPSNGSVSPLPDEPALWAEARVSVVDQSVRVPLLLQRLGHIEGQLTVADGVSPSEWGRTMVMAVPEDGTTFGPQMAPMGPVSDSGRFRTAGLPPGRYSLLFIEDLTRSPTGLYVDQVRSRTANTTGGVVELELATVENVEIALTRATGDVSGIVRDALSRPAPLATVYVIPADRARWSEIGQMVSRFRAVRPDADGTFQFRGLPSGGYLVTALEGGTLENWRDPSELAGLSASASRVSVPANGRVVIDIRALPRK